MFTLEESALFVRLLRFFGLAIMAGLAVLAYYLLS